MSQRMRKKAITLLRPIVAAALLLLNISCRGKENVELRLRLEQGRTYFQTSEITMDMTQIDGTQKVQLNTTASGRTLYRVVGENDSSISLKVFFDRMWMTMRLPNGVLLFDSENPKGPEDLFSHIMAKMTKREFDVLVSRNGEVISIDNLDSLHNAVFNEFQDLPEAQKQQVKAQLTQAYGPKAFKGSFETVMGILPSDSVSPGSEWQKDIKLEAGVPGVQKSTFTFKGGKDGVYRITSFGTIVTDDKNAYIPVNGMPSKWELSGTTKSEFTIEKETSWIIKAITQTEIEGKVLTVTNSGQGQGPEFPITMKMKIKVEGGEI